MRRGKNQYQMSCLHFLLSPVDMKGEVAYTEGFLGHFTSHATAHKLGVQQSSTRPIEIITSILKACTGIAIFVINFDAFAVSIRFVSLLQNMNPVTSRRPAVPTSFSDLRNGTPSLAAQQVISLASCHAAR
jgi:hypothetical protein